MLFKLVFGSTTLRLGFPSSFKKAKVKNPGTGTLYMHIHFPSIVQTLCLRFYLLLFPSHLLIIGISFLVPSQQLRNLRASSNRFVFTNLEVEAERTITPIEYDL